MRSDSAGTRLLGAAVLGALAGGAGAALWRRPPIALATAWVVAAAVFVAWVWLVVGRMDADATATHALREDPTRAASDVLVLAATVASLAGVGGLLVAASSDDPGSGALLAALSVLSVAMSWLVVHTRFTLRYARLYYAEPVGGVDFNQGPEYAPRYTDFAYLAFTIGMTFQVSDTDLTRHDVRATALRHGLLSFVLGSLVLATTVNLVASTL